jgi:hypothetical protein
MKRCVTHTSAGIESYAVKSPDEQSPGLFSIYKTPTIPVGASGVCFLEIVENNIQELSKRDIKPLQIAVLSRF